MTKRIASGDGECRCVFKLPFGEEVAAGIGGRTQAQGYQPDNIRQQFTGHERDGETGLDFMQARYYASVQGRFISPDEPLLDQWENDPQSWNLYTYVRNNPLRLIDPTGNRAQEGQDCPDGNCPDLTPEEAEELRRRIAAGEEEVVTIRTTERSDTVRTIVGSTALPFPIVVGGFPSLVPVAGTLVGITGTTLTIGGFITMFPNNVTPIESGPNASVNANVNTGMPPPYMPNAAINGNVNIHAQGSNDPRREASRMGHELVRRFRREGVGQGAGRSGGHGDPFRRAGAELIRRANGLARNNPLREALKTEGRRLIERGRSVSHRGG